ncbi:MAG: flagellar basal body-associated FliL family protein [Myxococcota bacterium]|jgi:flagellar basal body-associated protein FliL|nr:flagellar basal body-associated FliL family protein [Myxococcota bacterium]
MAEGQEENEEITEGSKLPMILGFVATLVLGAGVGFGASSIFGGGGSDSAETESADDDDEDDMDDVADEDPDRGIYPLGLFTVNLRGVGGGRVLRMEVDLELKLSAVDIMEEKKAGLRDAVIKLVSDYSYTDVEGLDGKLRLQDDLLRDLNKYMGKKARIERVYFSQFVVQ